jgi:hypothetical protein
MPSTTPSSEAASHPDRALPTVADRRALRFAMTLSLVIGLVMFAIKVGAYLLTGSEPNLANNPRAPKFCGDLCVLVPFSISLEVAGKLSADAMDNQPGEVCLEQLESRSCGFWF